MIGGLHGDLILEPSIVNLILSIGGAYIWARLTLLFPSTAVDHRMSFGECWIFTRGNGWRLLLVIFFVGIPIGALISSIENFLGQFDSLSENLLVALVNQTFVFVGFSVCVSALSISYRFLSSGSPAGTTFAGPSAP